MSDETKSSQSKKPKQLVWLELATTGEDSQNDHITGLACLVTDPELNVLAEGLELHFAPGNAAQNHYVETQVVKFLRNHTKKRHSPICGNRPCVTRRFLYQHMPELEGFFHYRHLEMFTIRDIARRWAPHLSPPVPSAPSAHASLLTQLKQAIAELKYYQHHLFISS